MQTSGAAAAVVAKNYKQLGIKTQLIAPPGAAVPEVLRLAGNIVEESGWIFLTAKLSVAEQLPANDTWRKTLYEPFKKIMQEKYGESKQINIFHSVAHDDMQVVIEALKAAGSDDRKTIRDALESVRYVGLNGTYACTSTDHRGITKWFGAVAVLKNGHFEPYQK
jgi:ABC-type branched-subunit amino acid transport system substrate-binding protein